MKKSDLNSIYSTIQCISHLSVAMDFGQDSLINGAMRSIYGAESFPLICIPNYDQMKTTPR